MKRTNRMIAVFLALFTVLGICAQFPVFAVDSVNVSIIVENTVFPASKGAPWEGTLCTGTSEIEGSRSAADAIADLLKKEGITQTGAESGYITEVNGLKAFDGGEKSGWMVTLNDWFMPEGITALTPDSGKIKDGDVIRVLYTLDWGADIGSDFSGKDTSLKELDFAAGILYPAFDPKVNEYVLNVPSNEKSVCVNFQALNKNFQVRIYKNEYKPENESEFKSGENIPVKDGDKIIIGVGNKLWPSMNSEAEEKIYTVTVKNVAPVTDSANVTLSVTKDGAFELYNNDGEIFVRDGIAEEYGYKVAKTTHNGVKVDMPTVFDLLVTVHAEIYGDKFTKETAQNYLKLSDYGFLQTAFGLPASATGIFVNGIAPNDNIPTEWGTTGYTVDASMIKDGDNVELFFYQDTEMYGDFYTRFSPSSVVVTEGTPVLMKIEGFSAMSAMGYEPKYIPLNGEDGFVTVNCVNKDGSLGEAFANVTVNAQGEFTLTFEKAGEYVLTVNGFDENEFPVIPSKCKVKVLKADESKPKFEELGFASFSVTGWSADSFSPDKFSYSMKVKRYSTSTLMMNKVKYDTEKYNAFVEYTDVNGDEIKLDAQSGKSLSVKNIPFGTFALNAVIADKNNPDNKSVYVFNITRPYDTSDGLKSGNSVEIKPVDRELLNVSYNGIFEGNVFAVGENGEAGKAGIASGVYNYRAFLFDGVKSFNIKFNASTAYAHMRIKIGSGEYTEYSGTIKNISLSENKVNICVQTVSDEEYNAYGFRRADSLGKTYNFEIVPCEFSSGSAQISTMTSNFGDWYPNFKPAFDDYNILIPAQDELPVLTFTLPEKASAILGGEALTPDENGKYTLALTTSKQTVKVKHENGVESGYTFKASKKSAKDVPDKVVDYLCINSQYTNSPSYGLNPEATLSGFLKSLGNFGGYITYYYEDAIKDDPNNLYGLDFYVYGNSFADGGSAAESGQVWVSEDGVKFYPLAGSEHFELNVIKDYSITYYKTEDGKTGFFDNYGNKSDGKAGSGKYPVSSKYYLNPFVNSDRITLTGILLPCIDGSITGDGSTGSFVGETKFGYVDYFRNGTVGNDVNAYTENAASNGFDLKWAVDENGKPVTFENGIHYIKVVTASNIWAGSFAEKSTEISYVVRTTPQENAVGKTELPLGIEIVAGEKSAKTEILDNVFSYELDAGDAKKVILKINGAKAEDNIYINNQRIAADGEAEIEVPFDGRAVRIIVQNGDAEPYICYVNITTDKMNKAKAVTEKINALGEITLNSREAIREARAMYEALNEEEKSLVTNEALLKSAEEKFESLRKENVNTVTAQTGDKLLSGNAPINNSVGGEWTVIGLSGFNRLSPEFAKAYIENLVDAVKNAGSFTLSGNKSTENSRVVLALTSMGIDPTNFGKGDFTAALADFDYVKGQGINGVIYALIAFESGDFEIPTAPEGKVQTTRELLLQTLIESVNPDGGFALDGEISDPDITAMALQALAFFKEDERAANVIKSAVKFLSDALDENGRYGSSGSEANAQVITALCALGINPDTDERFVKNGYSVLDGLISYYKDGEFAHLIDGNADRMATEQAYYSLCAYDRLVKGLSPLYDMKDVELSEADTDEIFPPVIPDTSEDASSTIPESSDDSSSPDTSDGNGMTFAFIGLVLAAAAFTVLVRRKSAR